MQLTKGAIGNLINRYKAVLKKCHLMNTFGSLAVAAGAQDVALGSGDQYDPKQGADHLMGGWLVNNAETAEKAQGTITLTVTGGKISEIIGGSYAKNLAASGDSLLTVKHGDITTNISGDTTSAEFVVGGSKVANDLNATLTTGKTSLTISNGTFGSTETTGYELVMGGNYVKTGKDGTQNNATTEGSNVAISDGKFHASVVGGSVAHHYSGNGSITVTDNGATSVNITGGTFAPSNSASDVVGGINLTAAVIGGGLAYGANTSSVLGSKEAPANSSVSISGDKTAIKGKVVAGSVVAEDGYAAVVHGNTTLTMKNGEVSDDLIGGGMVQDAVTLPAQTGSAKTSETQNAPKQPDHNLIVTGNAGVTVDGGTAKGEIVGGNYVRGNGSARVENSAVSITGGTFAEATDSQNKAQYVIGGSKTNASEGGNATTLVEGNSSVLIDGAVDIKDGALIGGSQAKAGNDKSLATEATAIVKGDSSVTVNKGTLAGVIGGGIAETYSEMAIAKSTVDGTSSVSINGGNVTVNSIETGAMASNTRKLSAAVAGGGLANDKGSTATVGSTSVTIADGTINGKVVAGGAAVNGGSSTVTNDTSLIMTGGKVDGDLIGGGFVDSSAGTANVGGPTHITVSGGSLVDAEIIGGGSVRNATGEANVKDTYVTVTKYNNSQDKQTWVQYVFGGGKAMTNGAQTATANVTGSTNVIIGEQDATGDAIDIEFGTVAGGGLARAQKAKDTAKANVTENANVIVHSGILSGVAGGGIAENYGADSAEANVAKANLTINGGTINGVKYQGVDKSAVAVLGGGIAKGAGAIANATTSNTVINGGTIKGHVVAGGLADGGTATVTNANLTIKGGEIDGSVYAGGAALNSGTASVDNFKVLITGGTITGDVVAGNYTEKAPETSVSLLAATPESTITIGGDAKIDGKVDASAGDVATNVVIDGNGATVTKGYEGNIDSTLAFNNYDTKFDNTATGFGNLNVAEGSNVQMDNLSTDTASAGEKGFFGSNDVTVTGKGTVKANNVMATGGKTITVADGSTLDAQKLVTKQEGSTGGSVKTEGLGSTLVIGNENLNDIDGNSLNSAAGSEIKFTGLGESVAATDIKNKLQGGSTGIVNVGDTTITDLTATNGEVAYGTWSTSGITNNELKKATLTGVPSTGVDKTGSFGSAQLAGTGSLNIGKSGEDNTNSLTLTGLDASENFVSASDGQVAGATINKNATLTLGDNAYTGDKAIGTILIGTGTATLNVLGAGSDVATVNSGAIKASGTTTTINAKNVTLNVAGGIDAAGSTIDTITADAANIKATSGDITANTVTLKNNGLLAASKKDDSNGGIITIRNTLSGQGSVVADKTLALTNGYTGVDTDALALQANELTTAGFDSTKGDVVIKAAKWGTNGATTLKGDTVVLTEAGTFANAFAMDGGALVAQSENADTSATLTFNDNATFTKGAVAVADSIKMDDIDKTLTVGSGTTLSAQHINLNNGTLLVDSAWGLASSNEAVASLSETASETDVTVNGRVGVGQNSYLALGTADTGWLPGVVGNYTKGVGLSQTGITAALGVFKGIEIDSGEALVVDGSSKMDTAALANTAEFANNSLLVVNGANIYGVDKAAISFETTGTLKVAEGAKLLVTDAVAGQDYTIVDKVTTVQVGTGTAISGDGIVWKTEGLSTTTDMISLGDAKFDSTEMVTTAATRNDAHTVFPNLSDGMANAVNDLYTGHAVAAAGQPNWDYADVNSADMGVRFLSRATDNRFLGMDKDAAAESIESAARIAFAGAVPQMTKMASDAGTNAVVNRLGFADPADGAQAMDADGKIVDRNTTGFALWIAPLWQSQHGWGMDADSMDYGFNGNLGGVSLGADYTFENAIRAGITFNIGGGYAESSGGDLSSTDNRMNFWGLGAYAGWNYENFGVMADVSYTSTWNDLKQDVDSRMGMGDLEADVQATAISAGLRAEYLLQTSAMDIIPHIGVRYMSLNTWGYDVDTHGGTVLEGDSLHQDIWTFPIGVTFSKDFALDSGWSFKPSLDFTVIPAAGDIKAKHDVHFTGLPGTYEVETQMMDYLTWQGGVGLELANDNMSIGVNYTLQAGQHTTGHGVFGSFRYEF